MCVEDQLDFHVAFDMEDHTTISLGRKIRNVVRASKVRKSKQHKKCHGSTIIPNVCTWGQVEKDKATFVTHNKHKL